LWSLAKTLQVPLDTKINELQDIPYTIAYVMRKRMQIDNFNELPEEKRPPEEMVWEGTPEEIDNWFDRVLKKGEQTQFNFVINEVEG
jgi:hypothetical protein